MDTKIIIQRMKKLNKLRDFGRSKKLHVKKIEIYSEEKSTAYESKNKSDYLYLGFKSLNKSLNTILFLINCID